MRYVAGLLVAALASACGDGGEAPADAAPSPDAAPAQPCEHALALCTKLAECAPFLLAAGYGDLAGCADRLLKVCVAQSQSDGSGMTLDHILACEAALASATCDDVFANNVPACNFRGSYLDGAACGDSSQCASGFCNHAGNLCGVCAPRGGSGTACPSGGNDECATGLVCSSGKVCAAPARPGTACDDATAPCLAGSFCTTAKTCALTVAAGAECPGAYFDARNGTFCFGKSTPDSPQLAAQIGAAGKGETCGLAPATGAPPTLCAPGSVAACKASSGSIQLFGIPTDGTCVALTEDGYTCDATKPPCSAGAQCIAGTCQIPSGRYCM